MARRIISDEGPPCNLRAHTRAGPGKRTEPNGDPDGVRLEITNFRAERRARLLHWEQGGA